MESPISPIMSPTSFPSPLLLAHSPRDICNNLNSLSINGSLGTNPNPYSGSCSPSTSGSPLRRCTSNTQNHQLHLLPNTHVKGGSTESSSNRNASPTSPSTAVNLLPSTSSISLLSLSFTAQSETDQQQTQLPSSDYTSSTLTSSTPGSPSNVTSSPTSPNIHPSSQRILAPPQRARMKHYFSRSTSIVISGSGPGSSVAGTRSQPIDASLKNNSNVSVDQLIPPESPFLGPMSLGSSPTTFTLNQGQPDLSATPSTTSIYFTPVKRSSTSSLVRPLQIPIPSYINNESGPLSIATPDSPTLHPVGTPAEEPMTPMVLEDKDVFYSNH